MTAPDTHGPGGDRPGRADPDAPAGPSHQPEEEALRRRRRAMVFGETLPDATRDERGDGWGDGADRGETDEWLRRQVPPHHG